MPVIRPGMRKPPPGFDAIADKLDEFEEDMKTAIQDESKGVVGQTSKPRTHAAGGGAKRARSPGADASAASDSADSPAKREKTEDGAVAADAAEAPVPPLWRVAQISNARTRYVFDACFRERRISKAVYDYCCEMHFIDGRLAATWRLAGYEHLCCAACGVPGAAGVAAQITTRFAHRDARERRQPRRGDGGGGDGSSKATCICRVPAHQRRDKNFLACAVCGCNGCCSTDVAARIAASKEKQPADKDEKSQDA